MLVQVLMVLFLVLDSAPVLAHGSERGLVMLLPTGYYLMAGALSVAASFILLAFVPQRWLQFARLRSGVLVSFRAFTPFWPSLCSFLFLCLLLYAGFTGSHDPLANPLPLFIWTLWWGVLMILQFIFGNLWKFLNPWSGPAILFRKLLRLDSPVLVLPEKAGYLPAILVFIGFVWFELVDLAPEDPGRLANVVLVYWCYTFFAILLFGEKIWLSRAEPFSIFFRLIGACSPIVRERGYSLDGKQKVLLRLAWPGANLLTLPVMPVSGVFFVLLTLGSVSFDGFLKTFTWLSLIDINPLEYPGRSAVQLANTVGLLGSWGVISAVFFLSVLVGCRLARRPNKFRQASGRLIYSIIPISLVFHLAHYLTLLLVNSQYAVLAFNDPFSLGWDILGAQDFHVTTSMLTNHASVAVLWAAQTIVITVGHVIGIVVAHLLATNIFGSSRSAALSQLMLASLMVLYTLFGLWLLSTPSVG